MGFWRKLFGLSNETSDADFVDKDGIYFYVECDRCATRTRVRADRRYDLSRTDGGYVWQKTIVCTKCFSRMEAIVSFSNKQVVETQDIGHGRFLTQEAYERLEAAAAQVDLDAEDTADDTAGDETASAAEETPLSDK